MILSNDLDNKARKIQEIANQLGWNSDINSLVKRVKEVDKGLIQEDEFSYILDWSDRCALAHKLEQFYIPPTAKKKYTIPDLFVLINDKGKENPFFIEVKTSKDDKLSWTETYYQGLVNYSKLTGVPILIAWKWKGFNIWTLFEVRHFKKSVSNFKIDFAKAMKENLMTKLLGDYFIMPYDEIGIHFKFKKNDIVEQKENETLWNTVCESIYITGKDKKEIKDIDRGLFALLFSYPMDETTTETETHILYSFTPFSKNTVAQSVLINLVKAFSEEEINWLDKIKKQEYPIKYKTLLDSLTKGIDKEIIEYILHLKPLSETTN
jgi:Holliday junction resolvase